MALRQLKLGDKVKLQLVQPSIKCSGRNDVTCFYKGEVIKDLKHEWVIQIKSKGQLIEIMIGKKFGFCITENFEDLQLK